MLTDNDHNAEPLTVERLTTEEMMAARPMWSEIFFEDSELFTEYYFTEKMPENRGYGLKYAGELAAMLFLTPYTGKVRVSAGGKGREETGQAETDDFRSVPLSYIVGVGTRQEYRHRGYMDRLLRRALEELHQAGEPFTFLMPADPAIYTPYQFRYIYERPDYTVSESGKGRAQPMERADAAPLAAFAERILEGRYQFFLERDASYYIRQQKESRAQNGDVYLWKDGMAITGFYLYAKEDEKEEIQEAVIENCFAEGNAAEEAPLQISEQLHPIIMARITDVTAMLSLLRLSARADRETLTVSLQVTDPLIQANNGTFLWTVGKKESTITLLEKTAHAQVCIGIAELTEFVFGRKNSMECFRGSSAVCGQLALVEVLTKLFLNEIV